jgi:hypothetical protein
MRPVKRMPERELCPAARENLRFDGSAGRVLLFDHKTGNFVSHGEDSAQPSEYFPSRDLLGFIFV